MSSHHIVREKQEPALLVLGLQQFTDDELGQLLEWSPTLIASAAMAEQLTVYEIKLDYIVGAPAGDELQSDVKIIEAPGQSWLVAALQFLVAQGYPAVNIVTDVIELSVYEQYAPQINLVVFCNRQKIYPVRSGFTKWKPASEQLVLLNATGAAETCGLLPNGDSSYQTLTDGFFKLKFNQPLLFIAEGF